MVKHTRDPSGRGVVIGLVLFTVFLMHFAHCIPPLLPSVQDFGNVEESSASSSHHQALVTARLPETTLNPHRYRMEIRPILEGPGRFTAPGKMSVTGTARGAVNTIVLNAVNIQIPHQSLSVVDELNGSPLSITNSVHDTVQEFFTVTLASNLVEGRNYTLSMDFVSIINTDPVGLYASVYTAADNSIRYLASTDFQAPDARLAFPNFDEPQLKAVWEIDIIRQEHYHSLANMDRLDTTPVAELPGWFRDSYAPSVPMSSYLICFAVSDFANETADSSLYSKPVVIWGPPPLIEKGNGKFSPDFSAKLMSFFESYYGIEYALPKMDKISIPDYASGAMENWGLNTYRDTRLLYEEGVSTAQDMFSMTNTISHELVHQWWGNLVTCEWWSDLWIQEGAATYYAPIGVAGAGMSDLQPIEALVTASVQRSFDFDANIALTHPIHNDGVDPANVAVLFDSLTYHKGAALYRMMSAIVSTATFNNAMTRFLNKYEYATANQNQMFEVLDEVIAESPGSSLPPGVNFTQIMETWTLQEGFPVITVDRNPFTNGATFSQERFFQRRDDGAGDSTRWFVPLAILRSGDAGAAPIAVRPERWLRDDQNSTYVIPVYGDWIIVNPQTHGYYRVLYKNSLLDPIIAQLKRDHTVFDVQIRSALIDDNLNLGYAGYLELSKALDLTLYLREERALFPWQSFFTNMALPYRMYARSSDFNLFKKYILDLTETALAAINIEPQPGEPNPTTLLRTQLQQWRCNLQDAACITFAKTKFDLWMANPSNPSLVFPDLQPSVYCTAMANGADAEWDFIWGQYLAADRDVMQTSLIRALACSKTSFRLNRLMEMALETDSGVRDKHRTLTMQAVAGNSVGVDLAFAFLRTNLETMIRRYGLSMPSGLVTTLSTQVNSPLEIADLEKFVNDAVQLTLTPTVQENLKKAAHWRGNVRGDFTAFLQTLA